MQGTVFPRPHKWAVDRKGRRYKAPMRPNEEWTDPETGRVTKVGPTGSAWTWQVTTGSKKRGDRRTHSKGGYRTKKAAEEALADVVAELGRGNVQVLERPSDELVRDYLAGWLTLRKAALKATTYEGYSSAVTAWINPRIGGDRLCDVTARRLVWMYDQLRTSGRRGGNPLSERSVQLVHAVLSAAFRHAVEAGDLRVNPALQVPRDSRPRPEHREVDVWTAEQMQAFLAGTATQRLYALWAFLLDSGARRGEALGARWSSLDLETGRLGISRSRVVVKREVETTPKNKRSRKVDLSPGTVAALQRWQEVQALEASMAGDAYTDSGYVFTDEMGAPLHPELVSRWFREAAAELKLPAMKLHGLRHCSAVLDLEAGTDPKTVQERLGHHSAAFTLDMYGHVTDRMASEAAKRRGSALYGAAGESSG